MYYLYFPPPYSAARSPISSWSSRHILASTGGSLDADSATAAYSICDGRGRTGFRSLAFLQISTNFSVLVGPLSSEMSGIS